MLLTYIHFKDGFLLFIKASIWKVGLREMLEKVFFSTVVLHDKKKLGKKFLHFSQVMSSPQFSSIASAPERVRTRISFTVHFCNI